MSQLTKAIKEARPADEIRAAAAAEVATPVPEASSRAAEPPLDPAITNHVFTLVRYDSGGDETAIVPGSFKIEDIQPMSVGTGNRKAEFTVMNSAVYGLMMILIPYKIARDFAIKAAAEGSEKLEFDVLQQNMQRAMRDRKANATPTPAP